MALRAERTSATEINLDLGASTSGGLAVASSRVGEYTVDMFCGEVLRTVTGLGDGGSAIESRASTFVDSRRTDDSNRHADDQEVGELFDTEAGSRFRDPLSPCTF